MGWIFQGIVMAKDLGTILMFREYQSAADCALKSGPGFPGLLELYTSWSDSESYWFHNSLQWEVLWPAVQLLQNSSQHMML